MNPDGKVNILLVDDQPAKLLSYESILAPLGETLVSAGSGREALEHLLKKDIAVVLMDVSMPEIDGFELAAMIREHPRFQKTAIIFVSAIHLADVDHLRGYEMGAVDYVPVPVVPEVLRAKVRVFAELYRKTRELEALNRELEQRVAERTAELEASAARLIGSEQRRTLALAAAHMGSWDCDLVDGTCTWDEGQCDIFGVDPKFVPTFGAIAALIHPEDLHQLLQAFRRASREHSTYQTEFRVVRPGGEIRWCIGAAAATFDANDKVVRLSGVTIDITDRREAEERQALLAREVDHRARNALAVVQAIVRLTRAKTTRGYVSAVEGRIRALAQTHTLLSQSRWQGADLTQLVSEELAPYRTGRPNRITISGAPAFLPPDTAQTLALALHELATNAAKYGALSRAAGEIAVSWEFADGSLTLRWTETGGPVVEPPSSQGFGTKIINASIRRQSGGDVQFDWPPQGLNCMLTVPFGQPRTAARADTAAHSGVLVQLKPAASKRVMLVEDEALVGMMMRDLVTEIGYFVAGPFCTLNEAMSAASANRFDVALIDVNLGGEYAYPLAEQLTEQGVPVIFLTGYDQGGIDPQFSQIPVLQKPVDREVVEQALRGALAEAQGPAEDPVPVPRALSSDASDAQTA
jgi:PAS domain S-box-containing protein